MKVGIIGGGRVGSCFAAYLRDAGALAGITASTEQHSRQLAQEFGVPPMDNAGLWQAADVLLLTVPDRLIGTAAQELAQSVAPAEKIVLHVSGSLGLEPLTPLQAVDAHVGSLHPLQSFAGGKTQLAGVYMALDCYAGKYRNSGDFLHHALVVGLHEVFAVIVVQDDAAYRDVFLLEIGDGQYAVVDRAERCVGDDQHA